MASYSQKLLRPNELNVNEITYSEPKKFGDSGGKIIFMNLDRSKIQMYTPKMRLPFGLNKFQDPGKSPKYALDMSFDDMENNQKIKEFYEKLVELDSKVIKDAKKNSLTWFRKKTMSEVIAKELYSSPVKYPKDKETGEVTDKYPPTFNVKLPYYDGAFSCEVFNDEKEEVQENLENCIHKMQNVTGIIEMTGLWFAGGKYGTSWKVKQLKLDKVINTNKYSFRDDDEDIPL
tara:strand:- start:907 stop:1602 length:696 start_codon:yes stop_codon:yes gene_type:complete